MRLLARLITRFFAVFEIFILKSVRLVLKPNYVVTGECVKCGRCCKEILFYPPRFIRETFLIRFFLIYHRLLHNFSVVGRGREGEFIFSCGHLKPDNRCGIHKWRPFICRNFPVVPFFEAPKILPYCSYQIAARTVVRMKERKSLPIVNSFTVVHHPSPDKTLEEAKHYHHLGE